MTDPNQSRRTPDDLWNVLDAEFEFTLDAAASRENARCASYYTEHDDALSDDSPWHGRTTYSHRSIFCNPPWSNPAPWLEKAYIEAQKSPSAVVVVVLHETNSKRVAPWLDKATEIRHLVGRPQFVTPGVANSSNPRDVQVIIYRRKLYGQPAIEWRWDWRKGIEA